MFENLSERLNTTLQTIRGQNRLSEDNIRAALRDVRVALLEADVALPVVKDFISSIRERALGQKIHTSLQPGQALIKLVHQQLVELMGEHVQPLDLQAPAPLTVLVAGLQGAGKTTSIGKLARYLKERENKRVLVTSCDVYRPAAMQQLQLLAEQVDADYFDGQSIAKPEQIAVQAQQYARQQHFDVLLVDTAGRLHVDDKMMEEIKAIHQAISPHETLFVVDAMTGQDAANTARAFNAALPLTGVVLTKADGDARGGAALSVRAITGKPIKFIGMGEKTDALEPFHPDRLASRILGMGDVLSLVEEVERKVDKKAAEKLARKVQSGRKFTLEDFRQQLLQMENMGGMASLMDKLPGMGQLPEAVRKQAAASGDSKRMIAIINSMTYQERGFPDIIRGSRKRRIAAGSGTQLQDINKLIKQFTQMQKMFRKMGGGGMAKMMKKMQGRLPKGMLPPGM
ncbi:MAG: signal recognition particle protein [Gammaproteobacteria bacterium]|jgi:signal recognition particle subunit SRP54|nr:signal recognition particle protein [Gammaproteobacteria bacterium]